MPPVKTPAKMHNSKVKKKKKNYFIKVAENLKSAEKDTLKEKTEELSRSTKSIKNFARLPTKPEEASSNWKNLCNQIKPVQTKGRLRYLEKKKKEAEARNEEVQISQKKALEISTKTCEPEIWFDDVDPIFLDSQVVTSETEFQDTNDLDKEHTKIMALDCEMVGVGVDGKESALARVSIVNQHGKCVYDKFVAPGDKVTDYRTQFSGIRPHNLINATELGTVCHEVASILRGRILVGHGLGHDLEVLMIKHPKSNIRDTSKYKVFRSVVNGATPSLKRLAQQFLGIEIQSGEHSSVQDAQAALRLYLMFRQQWERDVTTRKSKRKIRIEKGKSVSKLPVESK